MESFDADMKIEGFTGEVDRSLIAYKERSTIRVLFERGLHKASSQSRQFEVIVVEGMVVATAVAVFTSSQLTPPCPVKLCVVRSVSRFNSQCLDPLPHREYPYLDQLG